jgi:hypothetical protein
MKNILSGMFVCLMFVGCSSVPRINVELEPFSRAKIASLEFPHAITQGKLQKAIIRYKRLISEKETSSLEISFNLSFKADRNYTSMALLNETAQIRIDDSFTQIKMSDQKIDEKRTCGGFGFTVCSTVYTMTGKMVLSKEMEKKLFKAKVLMYQFKLVETVVIEISPAQLTAIKDLLSRTYSDLK